MLGHRLVREEGVRALWSGSGPALVRAIAYGGLRIGLYRPIKLALGMDDQSSLLHLTAAGFLSGAIASALTSPLELLKVQFQAGEVVVSFCVGRWV